MWTLEPGHLLALLWHTLLPDPRIVPPELVWAFLIIASLCVLLIGIDKSGFGGGIGTLATPLLALVVSPLIAAGILLPLLCACDLVALYHYRSIYNKPNLRIMLPGALTGVLMGGLFIWLFKDHKELAERTLKIMVGAISILFVIWQVGRGWLLSHLPPSRPGNWQGSAYGLAAGFTSTLAHAGGPPAVIYLLPQQLDRSEFVGTTVWFFAALNYFKLIPYALLGMLATSNLKAGLVLLPLVPVGVWIGHRLNRWMSQQVFMRVVLVVLFLTGLQLLSGKSVADLLHYAHLAGH